MELQRFEYLTFDQTLEANIEINLNKKCNESENFIIYEGDLFHGYINCIISHSFLLKYIKIILIKATNN